MGTMVLEAVAVTDNWAVRLMDNRMVGKTEYCTLEDKAEGNNILREMWD